MPAADHPAQRRQDIELLRIVAAFGIVWFHAAADHIAIGYSGLMAFVMLSVALGGQFSGQFSGQPGPPGWPLLRRRAGRLLLPWLVWSLVYGAVNLWRGLDALPAGPSLVGRVMAGPSIHLWYLPFIFLGLAGIDVLRAHVGPRPLAAGAGLVALAGIAAAPWWRPVTLGLPYPLLQWADAAVPLAAGLFLQAAPALPRAPRLLLALLMVVAAAWAARFDTLGLSFAIACVLCGVVLSGRTAALLPVSVAPVSAAMFGVYLLHPLVFGQLLKHTTLAGNALPLPIFCISLAVVLLLRRAAPRLAPVWS